MVFILLSLSSSLEFYLVHYTVKYENSESKVFKNTKSFCEISNNWPNELLGTNVCKTYEFCW